MVFHLLVEFDICGCFTAAADDRTCSSWLFIGRVFFFLADIYLKSWIIEY